MKGPCANCRSCWPSCSPLCCCLPQPPPRMRSACPLPRSGRRSSPAKTTKPKQTTAKPATAKRSRSKKSTTKAKAAKPKTPKTKKSARKSKPKKPKKKPTDAKLNGRGRAGATEAGPRSTGTTTAGRGTTALAEHPTQPGSGFAQMRRVDLVAQLRLAVGEVEPTGFDQLAGAVGELDPDHRVVAAVADEDAGAGAIGEARLPALDRRHEAAEGEDPRRRRPLGVQPRRVAHHRPHREAAEHGPLRRDPSLLPEPVVEIGQGGAGGLEALRIGMADPRHQIPVVAGRSGKLQRRPRRHHLKSLLRIEEVGEADQVALVGAAAVVEDQQSLRVAGGGAFEMKERLGHLPIASSPRRRRSC